MLGGGSHWLHLDTLTHGPAAQFWQVAELATEGEIEDIVRTYHAQGALPQLRQILNELNNSINIQVMHHIRCLSGC